MIKKPTALKILNTSVLAATSLLGSNALANDIMARVISSTPVVQQVAVPRQVCNNQQVVTQTQKSGGGALLGAVAGGAVGNAIGNGNGRAVATMIGLVGGVIVGDRVEGTSNQVQNVQQCSTQTFYENRASHFNVLYEYQGTQYNVQMAQDPGQFVKLQVTPVGAVNAGSAPQASAPLQQVQPAQTPSAYQPIQSFYQPIAQPGYVVQQPVFVAPVVIESYSTYYGRPHYPRHYYQPQFHQPFHSPVGVSLNFGYSRGHWR